MNALLDDLAWRGLIANSTDPQALEAALDAGPVSFYVGFDPTAPSLHIGHLIQLITARRLQLAGHRPVILVGGATGLIGDPRESGERVMHSKEVVAEWVTRLRDQCARYVDFDSHAAAPDNSALGNAASANAARHNTALMVNNLDWTAPMSVIDFLRDIGKHFPVNRMLAREVVASRLESGISYTEFSYVLLQSMDYLNLFRDHGVTLQLGGSDQWGNITAGVELIRRSDGVRVHALATPLITRADGTKFGKSDGTAPWLDADMFSPYGMYQLFLNVEDSKVIDYLKAFTFRDQADIDELAQQTAAAPHQRAAQRALADDVVDLVHGRDQRVSAERAGEALFGRAELTDLDERTLAAVADEIGTHGVATDALPTVTDALVLAGLSESRSAARRAIGEGGAYLNNQRLSDPDQSMSANDFLHGRFAILRRGRKTMAALVRE